MLGRPVVRLLAAVAVAGVLGLAAIRLGVTPTREAWSLVGADADGAMVYARLSVSNTGFLDQQLTTRFLLLPPTAGSLEHRAMTGPGTMGATGVAAGSDALQQVADGWELRIGGEGLAARVQLRGAAAGTGSDCAPTAGKMAGMVEDRVDGRLLSGPGIVVHTVARGNVENTALYVVGDDFAAGVDPLADCPAWVRAGGRTWVGRPEPFDLEPGVLLMLSNWTLKIRAVGDAVDQDAWAHALWGERTLASLLGYRPPHVEARRVLVRVDGPGISTLVPALGVRRF